MVDDSELIFENFLLKIILEDCAKPKTVEQFHSANREWCKKYDQYKTNLSKWQRLYDENVG